MDKKGGTDKLLAYSTVFLALVTAFMAIETWKLASESREASYRQIGVQTWLEFEKRFDSADMIKARRKLAEQLKSKPASKYEDISEKVSDFFEDLGIAYKLGYIDKSMARSSFSLYATRYWEALKPFTDEARRRYGADPSLYENFETLAKMMLEPGEKIDENQLLQLLNDESILNDY